MVSISLNSLGEKGGNVLGLLMFNFYYVFWRVVMWVCKWKSLLMYMIFFIDGLLRWIY